MKSLHIITPVKDSIDSTLDTIRAIQASKLDVPATYTIYNDNSTPENAARLHAAAQEMGITVLDIADLTPTPSPNYLFVLRKCQQEALAADAGLLIVESDVTVRPDTLSQLYSGAIERPDCGLAAAVTVDETGAVNYPYGYAKDWEAAPIDCPKHLSFCCTLLTPVLLRAVDFQTLDSSKNWFDVTISHLSLEAGLRNVLFCNLPVLHRPHASRPWKQLKYKNPLKYYWLKWTKGFDKI